MYILFPCQAQQKPNSIHENRTSDSFFIRIISGIILSFFHISNIYNKYYAEWTKSIWNWWFDGSYSAVCLSPVHGSQESSNRRGDTREIKTTITNDKCTTCMETKMSTAKHIIHSSAHFDYCCCFRGEKMREKIGCCARCIHCQCTFICFLALILSLSALWFIDCRTTFRLMLFTSTANPNESKQRQLFDIQ